MRQFPASPITALIDEKPRYNLGESVGPDLTVADLLGPAGLGRATPLSLADLAGVKLGYGTSAGRPELRALVAGRHGISDGQVLITTGAAAALFLIALLAGDGPRRHRRGARWRPELTAIPTSATEGTHSP